MASLSPPPLTTHEHQVHCWRDHVPDWTGPALERLYGNLFASLPQFRASRGLHAAHTYAVYQRGELRTLFVFSLRHGVVTLYNEVIALSAAEIQDFADYVFAEFATAQVISLRAVQAGRHVYRYPSQQYDYLEDTVVTLPDNVAGYTDSLSKNTRRNVRRYGQSVARELPGYRFSVTEGAAVDPRQIDAVIALNHARMAGKQRRSIIDQAETERLQSLARSCGLVALVTIDGRVCAGAISYRVGDNFFLVVLAHAPEYDRYSLGFLCCYWTISACIERGGREFHFLWGRYDYKRLFLGQLRQLDQVQLYRSRLALLGHAGLWLRSWWRARRRRLMVWLHAARHSDTASARTVWQGYTLLRRWGQRLTWQTPR
ncbi:GNAT family N-acetyltransferase [Duganella sp. FT80W]|uniref:GNAT family N-acetyltransferase n=1 Tax=Duganella guangzhouensis TaxID=2666084 RepID=A0A6I2KV76_9BURK|nr:GNAT family N-acetyltransferase [Duganella guangzhouensis]MRW89945.1 GNAT family N-acetyltransferase [Duganella guangzhouensis]